MTNKKISIIGLGLIGGSLARALKERMGITDITAVTRSVEAINRAVDDGTISRGFREINEYVWDSDIIFICTPVKYTMAYISDLAGKVKEDCIITDVGSTKEEIIRYVNEMENPPRFIGGHPMAGAEKTGYAAGFSHLFENAYYMLSPCKTTKNDSIETMKEIITGIGGIPFILDAGEHDRITASISHVPHIIAAALVNLIKGMESPDGKMQMFAAGGFKDITRIASSSPEMWESIVESNKYWIEGILDVFIKLIEEFKNKLVSGDSAGVLEYFNSAKIFRDSFATTKKGLITPLHEIIVNVIDKPGIIGEIAAFLGENNINLKNISVSNSREFEQGCLRISLPDSESVNIAFDLLSGKGYKVYMIS